MKSILVTIIAALCMLALPAVNAQSQKLKMGHVYEVSEPYHKWALWAASEIKRRTDNRYDIQVFPSSSLGKEQDLYQGLTLGTIDLTYSGSLYASRDYGPVAISSAPCQSFLSNLARANLSICVAAVSMIVWASVWAKLLASIFADISIALSRSLISLLLTS